MNEVIIYLLLASLASTALALARQIRLRRALEVLLLRLLSQLRGNDAHQREESRVDLGVGRRLPP